MTLVQDNLSNYFPYHDFIHPGQINERPSKLDTHENKDRSNPLSRKRKRKLRLKKFKNLLLQPSPAYENFYSTQKGVEGLNSTPLSYTGNISNTETPNVNPYANIYQNAVDRSIARKIALSSIIMHYFD